MKLYTIRTGTRIGILEISQGHNRHADPHVSKRANASVSQTTETTSLEILLGPVHEGANMKGLEPFM